jgi:hypothetical protein
MSRFGWTLVIVSFARDTRQNSPSMTTLYDKVYAQHAIENTNLIYIDRHLLHEVTSPQVLVIHDR